MILSKKTLGIMIVPQTAITLLGIMVLSIKMLCTTRLSTAIKNGTPSITILPITTHDTECSRHAGIIMFNITF
jgi:hypothetical protein